MTLMWQINKLQHGDGVILSNVSLREFANLDEKSLRTYRQYLHDNKLIHCERLGTGREYLYRVVDKKGEPLDTLETNDQAVTRLRDPKATQELASKRIAMRLGKKTGKPFALVGELGVDHETEPLPRNWGPDYDAGE